MSHQEWDNHQLEPPTLYLEELKASWSDEGISEEPPGAEWDGEDFVEEEYLEEEEDSEAEVEKEAEDEDEEYDCKERCEQEIQRQYDPAIRRLSSTIVPTQNVVSGSYDSLELANDMSVLNEVVFDPIIHQQQTYFFFFFLFQQSMRLDSPKAKSSGAAYKKRSAFISVPSPSFSLPMGRSSSRMSAAPPMVQASFSASKPSSARNRSLAYNTHPHQLQITVN